VSQFEILCNKYLDSGGEYDFFYDRLVLKLIWNEDKFKVMTFTWTCWVKLGKNSG